MGKRFVVRVMPKSFEDDWQESLKAVGVSVPKSVPETSYTPVNHNPMPLSIIIDLTAKRVVRRIVGVVPNSLYNGPTYKWDEFLTLLHSREEKR